MFVKNSQSFSHSEIKIFYLKILITVKNTSLIFKNTKQFLSMTEISMDTRLTPQKNLKKIFLRSFLNPKDVDSFVFCDTVMLLYSSVKCVHRHNFCFLELNEAFNCFCKLFFFKNTEFVFADYPPLLFVARMDLATNYTPHPHHGIHMHD